MEIKYKSSKFITYIQYVFTPIVLISSIYAFYNYLTYGMRSGDFVTPYLPMLLWVSTLIIVEFFQLKYIKIREDGILFTSGKIIDFRNIEWITQSSFGTNWPIILIKYKEENNDKFKTFCFFPEVFSTGEKSIIPLKEMEVTKFIRDKIIEVKPEYDKSKEPSRFIIFKIISLSALPFILISIFL